MPAQLPVIRGIQFAPAFEHRRGPQPGQAISIHHIGHGAGNVTFNPLWRFKELGAFTNPAIIGARGLAKILIPGVTPPHFNAGSYRYHVMKIRRNLPIAIVLAALGRCSAVQGSANVGKWINVAIGHDKALTSEGSITEKRRAAVSIQVAPEFIINDRLRVTETGILAHDHAGGK